MKYKVVVFGVKDTSENIVEFIHKNICPVDGNRNFKFILFHKLFRFFICQKIAVRFENWNSMPIRQYGQPLEAGNLVFIYRCRRKRISDWCLLWLVQGAGKRSGTEFRAAAVFIQYLPADRNDQLYRTNIFMDKFHDIFWRVLYSELIPKYVLDKFAYGVYGFHGNCGYLPFGRGRSPLNWFLLIGF